MATQKFQNRSTCPQGNMNTVGNLVYNNSKGCFLLQQLHNTKFFSILINISIKYYYPE